MDDVLGATCASYNLVGYHLGNEVILYGHLQSQSVQGKVFERLL